MGSPGMDPSGLLAQLGVGAILVWAGIYAAKWLVSKLDQKDVRIKEITDEYIAAMKAMVDKSTQQTELVTKAIADNTSAMNNLNDTVRNMTVPVRGPRASDIIADRLHQ